MGTPVDPAPSIDWVTAADLADGRPGRIGMTVLPGKHGQSLRYPGRRYRGDLDVDLSALRSAGVARLVLLVEDGELERWGDPAIAVRGVRFGLDVQRFPIPDGLPPRSADEAGRILDSIAQARATSDVAVACMGGVGRTGTIVACALVDAGWEPDAAIARVRQVRHPAAVETPSQVAFVRAYGPEHRASSAGVSP